MLNFERTDVNSKSVNVNLRVNLILMFQCFPMGHSRRISTEALFPIATFDNNSELPIDDRKAFLKSA